MLLYFLRIVVDTELSLFTWLEESFSWLNKEDLVVKNVLFERLLNGRFTGISPWLELNFVIIWHFEPPLSVNTSHVLNSQSDLSWLSTILDWHLAKVPRELLKVLLELTHRSVGLLSIVVLDLSIIQGSKKLLV
jgi:hypothetical protein